MQKICDTCGAAYARPKDYGNAQWAARRFCSPGCVRGRLKRLGPNTRYRKLVLPDGRTVNEHRFVMEQILGRKLLPGEHVHHKNGDREDNGPDNLEVVDPVEHGRRHAIEDAERRRSLGLPMGRAIAKAVKRALGLEHIVCSPPHHVDSNQPLTQERSDGKTAPRDEDSLPKQEQEQ
jgi:hypothetical protein